MADALRMLAVDAVERANSGHPGAPMGMADMAEVLWNRHLQHNPANPHWPDRDRFVLSNGHGSMLLYALLHLTGYDLPMDELKAFRRLHSKTPGHPEVGVTPGVETTTGPLGQGLANAVGMALAEKLLAQEFNREHDGEAPRHRRPLHLRVPGRRLPDGRHQPRGLLAGRHAAPVQADRAVRRQRHLDRRPRGGLVHRRHAQALRGLRLECHRRSTATTRRRSTPPCARARAQAAQPHGRPDADLLQDRDRQGLAQQGAAATTCTAPPWARHEVAATATALGWTAAPFEMPADSSPPPGMRANAARPPSGTGARASTPTARCSRLEAAEFERRTQRANCPRALPTSVAALLAASRAQRPDAVATRKASQLALDALAPLLPELFGGTADLTASNLTNFKGSVKAGRDALGQPPVLRRARVRHGRHHERHGPARRPHPLRRHLPDVQRLQPQRHPHGGADEAARDPRAHARLASAWARTARRTRASSTFPSLRLIPNLDVWRPCDGLETAVAWTCARGARRRPLGAVPVAAEPAAPATDAAHGRCGSAAAAMCCPTWPARRP